MTKIIIRKANLDDLNFMVNLALKEFWMEYGDYEIAEKNFRTIIANRWRSWIENRRAYFLICEVNDVRVGFLIFRWWFGWNGWLDLIVIDENFRGKSFGAKLLSELIKRVKGEGYRKICFAIKRNSKSIEFYSKFNAKKFGEIFDEDLNDYLDLYYINVG